MRAEDRENEEDKWPEKGDMETGHDHSEPDPEFLKNLLSISKEAQLLVECKDMEDELSVLKGIFVAAKHGA